MPGVEFENSLLLAYFRNFYREVARLKEAVQTEQSPGAGRDVWKELLSTLESQALEAGRSGAFAFEVYRQAQYVMAALADEIFLHLEWEGRSRWTLLESELFHSHAAGEVFFQRVEDLLRQRDPVYVDLAGVYFMALGLGFQGKYRGQEDQGRLEMYRRHLYSMIFHQSARLFEEGRPLFPQARTFTLAGGTPKKLPDPRIWIWLVVAILVTWLGMSHLLWRNASKDVDCMMQQVSDSTGQTDGCVVNDSSGAAK